MALPYHSYNADEFCENIAKIVHDANSWTTRILALRRITEFIYMMDPELYEKHKEHLYQYQGQGVQNYVKPHVRRAGLTTG